MNTDDPNRIIELIAATETLANAWQTMLTSNTSDLDPATVQTANADLILHLGKVALRVQGCRWVVKPPERRRRRRR